MRKPEPSTPRSPAPASTRASTRADARGGARGGARAGGRGEQVRGGKVAAAALGDPPIRGEQVARGAHLLRGRLRVARGAYLLRGRLRGI